MGRIGTLSASTFWFLFAWAILNVVPGIILFEATGRVSGITLSIILAFQGLSVFVIASLLRMEEATWRRCLGLIIGLSGAVVLVAVRETSGGVNPWMWVLLANSIPVLWAVTDVLIAAREPKSTMNPIAALGFMYLLSALLTLPIAMAQGQLFMISPGLGAAFWLILLNALVDTANYIFYLLLIVVAGAVFASQTAYVITLAVVF